MSARLEQIPGAGKTDLCTHCGAELVVLRRFPVLAPALVLAGCLLTFYLVGFPILAAGAWLWTRTSGPPRCPRCPSLPGNT